MHAFLPAAPQLLSFVLASLLLAVTPGPGVIYIVTRSVAQGRWAGLASVAGVALGNLANALAAALGLAALFAVLPWTFLAVKYAGALYLIVLGLRAWLPKPSAPIVTPAGERTTASVLRDGLWVALLNPKTTVFFAAFLPQFMHAEAHLILQGIVLGGLFVAIAAITDSLYALAAGWMAPRLMRAHGARALGRYLSGAIFISLGLLTALGGPAR